MFVVKSDVEIGSYLKLKIYEQYNSVRGFCIDYLRATPNCDAEDPAEIRRLCNRFSQITQGKKALQTYDLPYITELLNISCEDLLSCGNNKVPLNNRRTNYNIAFSKNPKDWEEYLNREDCIAAYADEFGKTVLDYAIEFKNYGFIKYLINKEYITLIAENPSFNPLWDFGAESKIKERQYEHKTLDNEFYENKLLRTHILSLAIANNDIDSLRKFRAREIPPQLTVNILYADVSFSEYYDEKFLNELIRASSKVFDYFIEEYILKANGDRYEITWLYPFIDKVVALCIKEKEKEKALKALDAIYRHNKNVYEDLRRKFLLATKVIKDSRLSRTYKEAVEFIAREFRINQEQNFVSLYPYYARDIEPSAYHIINLTCSTKEVAIKQKIDSVNELHSSIVNIPKNIIKDN